MGSTLVRVIGAQAGVATLAAAWLMRSRKLDVEITSVPTAQALTAQHTVRAANSIISASNSYGFVCTPSVDPLAPGMPRSKGGVDCRIMDLHRISEAALEFGLVSRSFTRKATSLREHGQCTIAFHDPRASGENGYCVLTGNVRECTDQQERKRLWKPSWSFFHPQAAEEVVVWRFTPMRVELVAHSHAISDDWAPVTMHRGAEDRWHLLPRRRDRLAHNAEAKG